jgi:transposase InsO family protein
MCVDRVQQRFGVSEGRACRMLGQPRSSQRDRSCRNPQIELRIRLRDLAASRMRYGYQRSHGLLRCDGWSANVKRAYRLYREDGLSIQAEGRAASGHSASFRCRLRAFAALRRQHVCVLGVLRHAARSRPADDLFAFVPKPLGEFEPGLREFDRWLDDDEIVCRIKADLARRAV